MIYSIKGERPMPARAECASRLRLALESLLADGQRQRDRLFPLRQLVKGSVCELQTRCATPCRACCAQAA